MSFKDISAKEWVINVRGSYKEEVFNFLYKHLKGKLHYYELESKKGWFYDTRGMLKDIDSDFIFFWIEDHINMVDVSKYDGILEEMKVNRCEHLVYSWWQDSYQRTFVSLTAKESESLSIYKMNKENIKTIENNIGDYFWIISCTSFTSLKLFKKIISSNHPKLKRWPKETPFDFEKRSTDTMFAPFIHAIPKYELFACIDDDHGSDGYSLIARKLYPPRELRKVKYNKTRYGFFKNILPTNVYKILVALYVLIKRIKYTLK